jgi:hypothetical protein
MPEDPVEIRNTQVTAPPPEYNTVPPPVYAAPRVAAARTTMAPVGSRARQFVWLAVAIVDVILALRFTFIALSANDTGFVSAMNQAGAALAYPFKGIFGNTSVDGHALQWACILAIGIYTIAAWVVDRLVVIAATHTDRGAPVPY